MLRSLRSLLATLLIVAGLVTTAIPALANESPEYAAWQLAMDEAALSAEATASTPTCTETGYSLFIDKRPQGAEAYPLPVECADITRLAPGDKGLVGKYHVTYTGGGTIDLAFKWELHGELFTRDDAIKVTVEDDQDNDYSPDRYPDWLGPLEPILPTSGTKKAPSLRSGDDITFTASYAWPLEAGNEYQGDESNLYMTLIVKPRGGGGGGNPEPPGGDDPDPPGGDPKPPDRPPTTDKEEPSPPATTGKVRVRVLGDAAGTGELVPIAHAPVSLGELEANTDAFGEATFEGLRFGSYTATATAANPLTGTEPKSGSATTSISAEEPDGLITILLTWRPPSTDPTAPPNEEPTATPTGSLTVRVRDGSERLGGGSQPIPNAVVQVGDRIGRTNANGEWFLTNLPLGAYEIYAEAVDPALPDGGERKSGSARAELTAAKRHDVVTIMLAWVDPPQLADPTPGSIVGRICAPRDPGARVWATNDAGQVVAIAVAATGRLGIWRDFAIEDLSPGTWILSLQSAGDPPVSQKVTVLPGQAATAMDFTLACTGEGATPLPSAAYFLFGGALLVGGIYLRRAGRQSAAGQAKL